MGDVAFIREEGVVARGSASPFEIVLSAEERAELERRARSYTGPYALVVRAKMVLLAAEGWANVDIAARCETSPQVVCRWRKRFFEQRLKGLEDAARSGRPRVFSPSVSVEIKAPACQLPATTGVPLSRWIEQVMTTDPYASARRVFWVVDNGSRHRGQASIDRLEGAWPKLRLIHLPDPRFLVEPDRDRLLHRPTQSRLPQRLHRPGPDQRTAGRFEDRYNIGAEPFDWTFTRDDLARLLERIAQHDPAAPAALPAAA